MSKVIIATFQGPNRFLSNFFPARFVWAGLIWKTAEHAYQAAKVAHGADKDTWIDKVHNAKTPGDAKRLGKKVPLRKGWEKIKNEMMHRVVLQKFVQNPSLMKKLVDTGDAILEEGNTWDDNYWGKCPPGAPEGENWLGKILMDIRDEYKDFKGLPKLAEISTFEQAEKVEQSEDR